jgi:hypothetical protein
MALQGLPLEGANSRSSFTPRRIKARSCTLEVAGVVPTAEEFVTALETVYDEDTLPAVGDVIGFSVDGTVKFRGEVAIDTAGGGPFEIELTIGEGDDEITFYVLLTQTGLY